VGMERPKRIAIYRRNNTSGKAEGLRANVELFCDIFADDSMNG